jgi:serine/threonine-protein kinase
MPQSPERPLNAQPLPADRRASAESPRGDEANGSLGSAAARRLRDFDAPVSSTLPGDPPLDDDGSPDDSGASADGASPNRESSPLVSGAQARSRLSREPKHEYVPGEMVAGKYQLSRLLGEGGMGAVWLARNIALDADVAVKLIRRERATPEAAQRLLQEARAAARLGHPSIVRVFDFGESEHNDPFIVMEVLNGESMRDLIERKTRLRPSRAVRMLLPIASALAAAHGKGIIHRDLKPDNILLVGEAGVIVPKVVDFGIAKLHQDAIATPFTQTGQIMGSPGYMSPEQLDGRSDIDQRADVWSFSVVLYEALTGARPFEGAHYSAMLSAILLKDPTPLPELGIGDAALWEIVSRGLAKMVNERWPTMAEMGVALARWALERGIENDITGISLAAHWLHGGDGPRSDGPPSAPYAAYLADDNAVSLAPRTPKGLRAKTSMRPPPMADDDGDEGRSTPPPNAAESPAGTAGQRVSSSRASPVLVVDPAPSSRRRVFERPLVLLAIGAFIFGIAGTWITRSFLGSPEEPADGPSALGDAPKAPGSPSVETSPSLPTAPSSAAEPTPNAAQPGDPNAASASPSASQTKRSPAGTSSASGPKKPSPTGTGQSAKTQKPPPTKMPLPRLPDF